MMAQSQPDASILLLGGAVVCSAEGESLRFQTRKALALLAVLARQSGKAVPRERLVGLLWGDKDEEAARANLRQCLAILRKDLAEAEGLEITTPDDSICLVAPEAAIDVARFEALAASDDPAARRQALDLYRGPFLDGLSLSEAGFEDWLRNERAALHARAVSLAELFLDQAMADPDPAPVAEAAGRLLRLDPLREDVHRALIRSYAIQGRRAQALAQYQTCRDLLARDLDVAPEPETEAVVAAVRAGTIGPNGEAAMASLGESAETFGPGRARPSRKGLAMVAAALLALVAGGLLWWQPWSPEVAPLRSERLALPLPDRPSIAVLAFDNLTEDPGQDYLSEAISESIITELSRFPELFVIARNSSFTYKDEPVRVQQVAEELGVRYVLEGSLQRSGNQIRVSAQLIDALKGNHLWAERYDREAEDLFTIQDEITRTIVATVQGKVIQREREVSDAKPRANLTALEYIWQGDKQFMKWNGEAIQNARALYEKARQIDPELPNTYRSLARVYIAGHRNGWTELDRDEALALAFVNAKKAVELAPYDYSSYHVLGSTYTEAGDQARALVEYDRALELNPNAADVLAKSADSVFYQGRYEEGARRLSTAMRLNPHYPDWWNWNIAWHYYYLGDYEAARTAMLSQNPFPNLARRMLAAIYVRLGEMDEARATIDELLKHAPDYTVEKFALSQDGKFTDPDQFEMLLDDVRKAGLPER